MTAYSVSGTLTPDATTENTGEPAGTYGGQPYWLWTNEAGTWKLFYIGPPFEWHKWFITNDDLGYMSDWEFTVESPSVPPVGSFIPAFGSECSGNATVAEVVAPADNTPDAFSFTAVTDADPSTLYTSDEQTITGMDAGTVISITGGEYRINGGEWTSDAGTIDPSDILELQATSSDSLGTTTAATVTVGESSVDWTIATKPIKVNFNLTISGSVEINFES